jgi:hypothetical protein
MFSAGRKRLILKRTGADFSRLQHFLSKCAATLPRKASRESAQDTYGTHIALKKEEYLLDAKEKIDIIVAKCHL